MLASTRTQFGSLRPAGWAVVLFAIPVISGCGGGTSGGGGDYARSRDQSRKNLGQIGRGLHEHHTSHRAFPQGGVFDDDGKAGRSWQTAILPHVGQIETYRKIDVARSWNDPANAAAFRTRVDAYEIPALESSIDDAMKSAGGYAVSHYAANQHIMSRNKGLRLRDVRDGSSNTLMAGEVAAGIKAWGDPSNYRDPVLGFGRKPDRFGGAHGDRTIMLFVDGSVREFRNNFAPGILRQLALPDDGEVLKQ